MRFRDDNRAQSVQVGAILLFATLVIALSIYQATVVPSQNADVEYKHSQTVQNQMTDVRNGILRTAATGNVQPVSVTLGTQYPSRVFLMNPPPATGTLRTGSYDDGAISVSNINATNNETRDFLNGSWTASTKYLEYEPDYNEYDNAPNLLYETSILSNFYPNTNDGTAIPLTDQLLVDNETRTITLVTLNGSLSTSRASSVSVSPETLSAPYQRVQVQPNETGEPVNVSVPTRLSASQLENRTDLGSHPEDIIDVVDKPEDRVVVQVNWTGQPDLSNQFTLQTARIGVGSGTENPPAHYLTLVENRGDRVTVEARDRFNNAESGVTVSVNDTSIAKDTPRWTNEDGQVTFEIAENRSSSVAFYILEDDINDTVSRERVNVSVDTTAGGGGSENGGGENGGGQTSRTYVSAFNDGDGTTEPNEDNSIPTQEGPYGNIMNFDSMTAEDGNMARVHTDYVNPGLEQTIDVGTRITNIDTGSSYALEFEYFFENEDAGQVNLAILDENGNVLQSSSLDQSQTRDSTNGSPPEMSIQLNSQASNYVNNNEKVYVEFRTPGSEKDYTQFLIDYLRIQTN